MVVVGSPRQTITHLPVGQLSRHPGNVRQDLGDLTDLARSIRENGILQSLTVTEHPSGGYLIIAGHRRLGGALLAGRDVVPVVIRHGVESLDDQLVLMIVENVQRRDLTPIEKAEAYAALKNRGMNVAEISRRTGVSQSTISTLLTLLELDEDSRERVRAGELNAGTAIAAVREVRQRTRQDDGQPSRGRPVVVEPHHIGSRHPLFKQVARICGHTTRPKIGDSLCCGQCWEAVIRADALSEPLPEPSYDEVVVDRILSGVANVAAAQCDRIEVVRRWRATGRSLADLERQTGWKVDRYFTQGPPRADQAVAS